MSRTAENGLFVCWLIYCLTSQQHASVSQGRTCSDKLTCCHTETEVADQTFYLTQSQYTDTGPTSPSDDLITPGAWQGSHWRRRSRSSEKRSKKGSNGGDLDAVEDLAVEANPAAVVVVVVVRGGGGGGEVEVVRGGVRRAVMACTVMLLRFSL